MCFGLLAQLEEHPVEARSGLVRSQDSPSSYQWRNRCDMFMEEMYDCFEVFAGVSELAQESDLESDGE